MQVEELNERLRSLIADEYLAAYQYSIGADVADGPGYADLTKEMRDHATEELAHARKLVDALIHHGGKPPLSPEAWHQLSAVGYITPSIEGKNTAVLLRNNLDAEEKAIAGYEELIAELGSEFTDVVNMLQDNLTDEYTHAFDLTRLIDTCN